MTASLDSCMAIAGAPVPAARCRSGGFLGTLRAVHVLRTIASDDDPLAFMALLAAGDVERARVPALVELGNPEWALSRPVSIRLERATPWSLVADCPRIIAHLAREAPDVLLDAVVGTPIDDETASCRWSSNGLARRGEPMSLLVAAALLGVLPPGEEMVPRVRRALGPLVLGALDELAMGFDSVITMRWLVWIAVRLDCTDAPLLRELGEASVRRLEGKFGAHIFEERSPLIVELATRASISPAEAVTGLVCAMLAAGVPVATCSDSGETVLHAACAAGEGEIARAAFEAGANPHLPNSRGQTPAALAERCGHAAILAMFRASRARADLREALAVMRGS